MKNKFNLLTSKEWLPFQKSWIKFESDETLYNSNIRFFTKADELDQPVLYFGDQFELFSRLCVANNLKPAILNENSAASQFVFIDLRTKITKFISKEDYYTLKESILSLLYDIFDGLVERRFVAILAPNVRVGETYLAYAWDLAEAVAEIFSLKDEKIVCFETGEKPSSDYFDPELDCFYSMYFRKDEQSKRSNIHKPFNFLEKNNKQMPKKFDSFIPTWFILKPQRRTQAEILHPAKYPEDLVKLFINIFTEKGDNVFDPMSGTGSSQLGALMLGRNGYGTELSEFFAGIANGRCDEFLHPKQLSLFGDEEKSNIEFKIINKDAKLITSKDFPPLDFMVTSPPYWDMLNMKGAENQAKRIDKGLKTNYSDDPDDLGNIADYYNFLYTLRDIYFNIASLMKPGAYMTIVVKNIKKKGTNYPFAWDLAHLLQEKLILMPEVFWCQDDISIAPFGYGNTWVSNTFHQYCLNFQIPYNDSNNLF